MAVERMSSVRSITQWVIMMVALALLCGESSAKCAARSIHVWPQSGRVPINAIFVVEGYMRDQVLVENVASCELMLVSASDRLCLIPDRTYIGEFHVSQVILRPERTLTFGATYALSISEDSPRASEWTSSRYFYEARESLKWTADLPKDELAPEWLGDPEVINAEIVEYGCGPAIGADIQVRAKDESPTMALATIIGRETKSARSYLMPVDEDVAFVGHGMCSGGFDLAPGAEYRATVTIIDVAGNIAESPPKEVKFTIPHRRR